MEKNEQIQQTENEIKTLKAELKICLNAIKDCKDSETRKSLFEEKKEIQADIESAEFDLKNLKEVVEETPLAEPEPTVETEPIAETKPTPEPTNEINQVNNQ